MSKILITGAGGFIANHLIDYLLHDGVKPKDLRLFDRSFSNIKKWKDRGCQVILGDICNLKDVSKATRGVSVIYHLAVKTGRYNSTYNDLKTINVDGTKNLVNVSIKEGVKKFIFFSSTAVYGSYDLKNYNEENEKKPDDAYGLTKFEAERIIVDASKDNDFHYIIIRPTHVFGSGSKGLINHFIHALKGKVLFVVGNGRNKIDFIYVKDLVGIVRVLEKSKVVNDDFIVSSRSHVSVRSLINTIHKKTKSRAKVIYIPKPLVVPVSLLSGLVSKILKLDLPLHHKQLKTLTSDYFFDVSKLEETDNNIKSNYSKIVQK